MTDRLENQRFSSSDLDSLQRIAAQSDAESLEQLRVAGALFQSAGQAGLLMNGGALLAIFTYIGSPSSIYKPAFLTALTSKAAPSFVIALIFTALSMLISFVARSYSSWAAAHLALEIRHHIMLNAWPKARLSAIFHQVHVVIQSLAIGLLAIGVIGFGRGALAALSLAP